MSSPTLVVIDVQNGFVNARTEHALPMISRLLDFWESRDWPIVFSRFHNQAGSGYEKWIHWTRLRADDEVALHSSVAQRATTIIDKDGYTVFTSAGREALGVESGDVLVICGIATDSCVLKTAVDAFEAEVEPVVAIDACATHGGEDAHAAGILIIERFIGRGQVLSTDDVIGRFGSANGHRGG